MSHADRLNAWHLELAILADAIGHVLTGIEEPEGLSATAYVLRARLADLVESCPFPDAAPARIVPAPDLDPDDIDDGLPADLDGVPAELLMGGRDD
ncbi:MAG: hypothetical protein ACLGG2_02895 [Gammaproteobacteria bacterium]